MDRDGRFRFAQSRVLRRMVCAEGRCKTQEGNRARNDSLAENPALVCAVPHIGRRLFTQSPAAGWGPHARATRYPGKACHFLGSARQVFRRYVCNRTDHPGQNRDHCVDAQLSAPGKAPEDERPCDSNPLPGRSTSGGSVSSPDTHRSVPQF